MTSTAHSNVRIPSSEQPASRAEPSAGVMRQTQGTIGVVILAGLAAGYFVGSAWLVVPAIVGGGLLMSGFTGVCPMASLIARMPWNRARASSCAGERCCGS